MKKQPQQKRTMIDVEELFTAINLLGAEKGIPVDLIYSKIRDSIVKSAKKSLGYSDRELSLPEHFERSLGKGIVIRSKEKIDGKNDFKGILEAYDEETVTFKPEDAPSMTLKKSDITVKPADNIFCELDPKEKTMRVYRRMEVVEEVEDRRTQLTLDEARNYNVNAELGKTIDISINTMTEGRIFAQNAKSVLRQGIREAESERNKKSLQDNNQEVVDAVVVRILPDTGDAIISIGNAAAKLPRSEQIPGELLTVDSRIKVFVSVSKDENDTIYANVSRRHPGLVKRLFESEVTEVSDGTVEIISVSREAGSRTKIAVASKEENVDAVGACIGQRGQRVNRIIEALGGEKIDIVRYSEDIGQYITAALAPAQVTSVTVDPNVNKCCHVVVPDNQLSLAIGNKGQNVRLAAKLTGWKIDIIAQSNAEA